MSKVIGFVRCIIRVLRFVSERMDEIFTDSLAYHTRAARPTTSSSVEHFRRSQFARTPTPRVVLARRRSMPRGRNVIAPVAVSLWERRGWKKNGREYTGWFSGPQSAMEGRIVESYAGDIDAFVRNPPPELREHPHWVCFHERPSDWWWIHWSTMPRDVNAAIIAVEHMLYEMVAS